MTGPDIAAILMFGFLLLFMVGGIIGSNLAIRHTITKAVREDHGVFLFTTNKGKHYRAIYNGHWTITDLTSDRLVADRYPYAQAIEAAWATHLIDNFGTLVPDNFDTVSKLRAKPQPKAETYNPSWD